jgi:regulator of sigma E protease
MIQVAQILFILSVLVILHEFGHYIAAKIFKVRVEKFYLFMDAGFSLFKKKIGETEWGIGWLPIGGYVKLSGMVDESMDLEQMEQEPQPWEFRSKPAWQRLIIMLGGIIVNILLAWFIFTALYSTVGKKTVLTDKFQKNGLSFTETGHKVGFKEGDKIVSVDGKLQPNFNRMVIDMLLGEEVIVDRNGQQTKIILDDNAKKLILGNEGKNFIIPRVTTQVDSVTVKSNAALAGLQKGDIIVGVNKTLTPFYADFKKMLEPIKNDSLTLAINRSGSIINLRAKTNAEGKLGIILKDIETSDFLETQKMGLGDAFVAAVKESTQLIVYNVKQLKLIVRPKTEAYKQVKSPIGIARMLPDAWNWEFIWSFTALFSVGLAFMNILPIPGLDGGHALFTIVEMITGKTLSPKAMGYVQTGGMIFLLSLMALTFGKDIYQLVIDKFL